MMDLVCLSGTKEELGSSQALKILATAAYAGVTIETTKTTTTGDGSSSSSCPVTVIKGGTTTNAAAASSGLTLTYKKNSEIMIVLRKSTAAQKLIAKLRPAVFCDNEECLVDAWLSFGWSSLDVPLLAALDEEEGKGSNAAAGLLATTTNLAKLEAHLLYKTYLVGESISLADIALCSTLYTAISRSVLTKPLGECVQRWYDTITNQSWFQSALKQVVAYPEAAAAATTAAATFGDSGVGVALNGTPTVVQSRKYARGRVRVKEILMNGAKHYLGQEVIVAGWARTIRKASSKLMFVELNDGSTGTSLQCVLNAETTDGFDACKSNGGTGASFRFTGRIVASEGQQGQQVVDCQVTHATLLGAVYGGNLEGTSIGGMVYPLSKKEHSLEYLREQAHLRPRAALHAAAMRVRHAMAYCTHHFFHSHGFLYIHTPILTGADCEGAGEQFGVTTLLGSDHLQKGVQQLPVHPKPEPLSKSELKRREKAKAKADPTKPTEEVVEGAVDYTKDFFGQRINLTVSGQLNVETHACALSDVYTFGPTFRAEESRTYRHLSEFWMIEPELCFADLTRDIDLAEDYLKYCVEFALDQCADDLEFFEQSVHGEAGLRARLRNVLENEFKRLSYTEAIEILQKAVAEKGDDLFETKPEWGIDLPTEHERYICEQVFNKPVVIYDYPKEIKAFYMKLNDDEKTVAAADVLVPKIGEIIGGSQREHRLEVLKRRCQETGLDPRNVWWYLDLRRYGTVPHAGFGLGFERLILFITGLDNIRDVIPFPRWVGNAKF